MQFATSARGVRWPSPATLVELDSLRPDFFAMTDDRVLAILREAKMLAQEYRQLTGKPLGITGEVAEYEAWRILGVELSPARNTGYDAVDVSAKG
jgi:hypothetical protein